MPQPRIPRENGDNITINRPPQEPAFDSSNGHSFPGNGSYYEPQEPARPQYTFANAPKVGTGIPNKYGKVIYPDSHKLFIGNLFTECKDDLIEIFSPFGEVMYNVTSKKSPNVYKSCPKIILLEKLHILTPLQKLTK